MPHRPEKRIKGKIQLPLKMSTVKKTSPGRIVVQKSLERGSIGAGTQVYGTVAIKNIKNNTPASKNVYQSEPQY